MQILQAQSTYKDQPAVVLETDQLQVKILPHLGAKIASLIFKPLNKELLFQRPYAEYKNQPYDGIYTDGENSGIDDMFPTIDACSCLQTPWQGVKLPDHGEVWSLPWRKMPDQDGVTLSVDGMRLPYTLEKRISFTSTNNLRMDYRLTNHAPYAFDYLWAAHTMFNSEEGTEVMLPKGANRMAVTFSNHHSLGKYGQQFDWPVATLLDGSQRDLSKMRSSDVKEVYKYYLLGALPEGWCAARFHRSGYAIGISWPVEKVPYLAVLPNEGGWDQANSLYFEPSTCTFDRPDLGRNRGEVSTLGPMVTHSWHLNLSVTQDLGFTHISSEGVFA